jgi:signal transduction histidine kinase
LRARDRIEVRELQARVGTLEQLLEVYERSVVEQSDRLYAEQERIRFQKTLLECQGEASLDGVLSVGIDGVILFANRRLSEMWGMPEPVLTTSSYDEVIQRLAERTVDPAGFRSRVGGLENAETRRDEVALIDGRTFDQYTAPIRSEEGRHFGRVWHFRDISAFKQIDRMKDEFVSAVSHELRTPLTSIRGALDLMAGGLLGELPAEAVPVLRVALSNSDRLARLIDDILDLEKIEAGRMDFHPEVLELGPLLEEAVETMQPYGVRLGVTFRIENTCSGAHVRVDRDRLMQVMQNLLSNAAKFSPEGATVEVGLADRGRQVRVSVTDHGPGIAAEVQSRLFERFVQSAPTEPRHKGGTGLGLNIARAIVERSGGTIGFVSRPGMGTTFHVDLPAWDAERGAGSAS